MSLPGAPPGLVWLASYFKSGNTWMRLLLLNLQRDGDEPCDINELKGHIAADRSRFEGLALIDSTLMTADEIERLRPAVHDADADEQTGASWVKVHDAYSRLKDGTPLLGRKARAVIYLVRDPRDVVISHSSHMRTDLDRAIHFLLKGGRFGGEDQLFQQTFGWSGHVESWLSQTDLPVHLVRYEDLRANTHAVFRGVLDFLGVPTTERAVARAVRNTDFSLLQRQEAARGFRESAEGQARFFRKGQVGEWRDALSDDQILAIETAAGPTMDRLGYQVSRQEHRL